jgi:putative FmdB family regulatory protein
MPIYEYTCESCGKRSSALLKSYSEPAPHCPHCGADSLRRLVSTFATSRSGDDSDFGGDFDGGVDDPGEGDDLGGDDYGGFDDDF